MESNFGIIGLAVMGENLALNIESRGFRVSVFNRTYSRTEEFMNTRAQGRNFFAAHTPEEFCASLQRPRRLMLMVKAGEAVDRTIEAVLPFVEAGDVIIDGGNSHFTDTQRRVDALSARGVLFVGCGVSGGELGALHGPSLMPGGAKEAWPLVRPVLEAVTAIAGADKAPCCAWMGRGGAGHFVKMVHNGIEYGDMQVITEAYDLLRHSPEMNNDRLADLFAEWNRGRLQSYLIEITADIFRRREGAGYLVDAVLDAAGQKGTGKWTAVTALDEGIPLGFITESVFARCISAQKELRVELSDKYDRESTRISLPTLATNDVEAALYASKLISYAQGFELIAAQSREQGWDIPLAQVPRIWRGGCIIRSRFLDDISTAFEREGALQNLLLSDFYRESLPKAIPALRRVVAEAVISGVPVPAMSAALAYYDSATSSHLPANLLQAQRDYFGAHTFERVDRPRGEFFHESWV